MNPYRIVVVTDLHPDVHTLGVSRFDEVERAFDQAVDHAIKVDADAFLFLGDLVDPDSGSDTFKAICMLLGGAVRLAKRRIKVILIPGNHDVMEDGGGATTLTPLLAIAQSEGFGEWIYVLEDPALVDLREDIILMALPFTPSSRGVDLAEWATKCWPKGDQKVIVASHLSVPGIIPGEETTEMPRGREISYPFEATKRAIMRLQGHYHRKQVFDPQDGGPPIIVPGSLARLTFGEQDHTPSFIEVEI